MSSPNPQQGDLKELLNYESRNIRRPIFGGVFLAPDTAPLVETLVAANGQVALPAEYESVGRLSEDGLSFSTEMEVQEVRGWGSTSVLRRDIQSTDASLTFSMLESRRVAYEVHMGLDLSNVEMSADGEWKVTRPGQPSTKYWRAVAIGADGDGAQRFYMAKVFGRVSLTETDDETFQSSDEAPRMFQVTLGADEDDEAGGPYTEFLFGPGALAAAERMGITVAAG